MLGKVSEWSNVLVSKTGVDLKFTVGSNPTLSAKNPLFYKGFFY